jgi:hypothetical protein
VSASRLPDEVYPALPKAFYASRELDELVALTGLSLAPTAAR